jgi:hypothetical protein
VASIFGASTLVAAPAPASNANLQVVSASAATTPAWSAIARNAAYRLWGASVTKDGSWYRDFAQAPGYSGCKDSAGTHTNYDVNSTKAWITSYSAGHMDPHSFGLGVSAYASSTTASVVVSRDYLVNNCLFRATHSLVRAAVTSVVHGTHLFKVYETYAIWQSQGAWFISWTASIPVTTGTRGSRSAVVSANIGNTDELDGYQNRALLAVVSTRSTYLRTAALLVAYDVYAKGVAAAPRGFNR